VLDAERRLLASSRVDDDGMIADLLDRADGGATLDVTALEADGRRYVGAIQPLPSDFGAPLFLGVAIPERSLSDPFLAAARASGLFAGAILV
jgi:hypothetical protein